MIGSSPLRSLIVYRKSQIGPRDSLNNLMISRMTLSFRRQPMTANTARKYKASSAVAFTSDQVSLFNQVPIDDNQSFSAPQSIVPPTQTIGLLEDDLIAQG